MKDEVKAFLELILLQGYISTVNVRQYFSYFDPLYFHPLFPFVMSCRRFEIILRIFCCADQKAKKIQKVKPLLDMLLNQFQSVYSPQKELSLDEQLLHFRGVLSFRVYIKNKKDSYGIKFFELTI